MALVWSSLAQEIKPGFYRHYKGNLYKVLGLVRHSETLEELVVYQAMDGTGLSWVRPLSMFCEMVTSEGMDPQPRFSFVGDTL